MSQVMFARESATALTEDLRFLVAKHPRSSWRPGGTLGGTGEFWLQKHGMFRDLSGILTTALDDHLEGRLDAAGLQSYFAPRLQFFIAHLHGHHQIEDQAYFPAFRRAEPRLARGFDLLDADHEILHGDLQTVANTANALLQSLRARPADARAKAETHTGACRGLVGRMIRHLDDEEDLIIPLLIDRGEDQIGLGW